jgi:succinate dehydrogenase / fumarate reductase flavoprotein subunit
MGRLAVVGGGLAGLAASLRALERGADVDLFSLVPPRRSHSVCAQGGINGAVNTKGEGDSPWQHLDDTVYGGDFLAQQPPVRDMVEAAPGIIYLFDRMGVPFNRTAEGMIDFRRFGGTRHHRTAFAGATTGQQLLYALDEQVRRYAAEGRVRQFSHHDLVELIWDGRACRGVVVQDLTTLAVEAHLADAVVLATGGLGRVFGRSTNSLWTDGSATAVAYRAGVHYANPEMIQVHPTAIPGEDKLRLMSESARGEGGRVWVYRDGRPWYFLEEWFPEYGNLVPRDVATRAIFRVVVDMGLGVDGKRQVYLDVSHLPAEVLDRKLAGILETYRKFVGEDPHRVPMRVFPAVHYSMGGLWVDFGQETNLPGLFACGECDYQYHGANRLGANSLLSCVHGGFVAGERAAARAAEGGRDSAAAQAAAREAVGRARRDATDLLSRAGPENPYVLHAELGEWMTDHATVIRRNDRLRATEAKLLELEDRLRRVGMPDTSRWANHSVVFTRHLEGMLSLARAIVRGALLRDESRGAHYKPEFPDRDDARFLATTIADWRPEGPAIAYEAVDTSLIAPRPRRYDRAEPAGAPPRPGVPAATRT